MEDAEIDFVFFSFHEVVTRTDYLLSQHSWGLGLITGREDIQSLILGQGAISHLIRIF